MGFSEVITLILIVLKLTNIIDWSWFFVLLPQILFYSFDMIMTVIYFIVRIICWSK